MSYPTRPALHCSWNTKAAKSQTSKVTRSANSTPQPSWAAEDTINHLSKHLGVTFDTEMLRLALTHRSYAFEHDGLPTNERLEFLGEDRKSTRLNSSHVAISYAVFCLKKKKETARRNVV